MLYKTSKQFRKKILLIKFPQSLSFNQAQDSKEYFENHFDNKYDLVFSFSECDEMKIELI